jgi:GNAT superfamily N-acetyltransferase
VEGVIELRHRVLRFGLPRETAVFAGDAFATSRHFAAVDGEGWVVGCLTLHLNAWEGRPAYQLRGMATDDSVRGKGVGMRLMESAEAFVVGSGVGVMWCNARVPAVGFYLRAGWEVVSAEFDIPTAGPHVRMVKMLGER